MRTIVLGLSALLLVGCSSEGRKAEERFAILQRNGGTPQQLCDASKAIAEGYLADGNEEKYRETKEGDKAMCAAAAINRMGY